MERRWCLLVSASSGNHKCCWNIKKQWLNARWLLDRISLFLDKFLIPSSSHYINVDVDAFYEIVFNFLKLYFCDFWRKWQHVPFFPNYSIITTLLLISYHSKTTADALRIVICVTSRVGCNTCIIQHSVKIFTFSTWLLTFSIHTLELINIRLMRSNGRLGASRYSSISARKKTFLHST